MLNSEHTTFGIHLNAVLRFCSNRPLPPPRPPPPHLIRQMVGWAWGRRKGHLFWAFWAVTHCLCAILFWFVNEVNSTLWLHLPFCSKYPIKWSSWKYFPKSWEKTWRFIHKVFWKVFSGGIFFCNVLVYFLSWKIECLMYDSGFWWLLVCVSCLYIDCAILLMVYGLWGNGLEVGLKINKNT